MKIRNKKMFYLGIIFGIFLVLIYFIKFDVESGANYNVQDSLLGVLIFHNVFVFAIYVLIAIGFISFGLGFRVKVK